MDKRNRIVHEGFKVLVSNEWIRSYRRTDGGYWSVIDRRDRYVDIGQLNQAEAFLKGVRVASQYYRRPA